MRASLWYRILQLLAILLLLSGGGCAAGVEPPEPVLIEARGSTAMAPIVSRLAEAYAERRPHVSVEIQGGGSQLGIDAAVAGEVEIGLVARELLEEEIRDPRTGARRLWPATIAVDAIAVVVNPVNPLDGMSMEQLRRIFTGEVWDWGEFGAPEMGEIQLISRESGSGTRAAFEAQVMQGQRVSPTALVMTTTDAVLSHVAEDPSSLAYVSAGSLTGNVKPLRLNGVEPTADRVVDGSYPLHRPLLFVTRAEPRGETRAFLEFILSPAGQAIVAERYARVR